MRSEETSRHASSELTPDDDYSLITTGRVLCRARARRPSRPSSATTRTSQLRSNRHDEDLTAPVDISDQLRIDRSRLRQRLEALQDRYLHLLVAPGQVVFARPRGLKPPPGSDAHRGGGGGAAAEAATHADAAALLYAEDESAHQGEHGENQASGGDDANDETEAAIRYRVEAIEAPLEALLPSDGDDAPKPFSTPVLFRMSAAPPGGSIWIPPRPTRESQTTLGRFELDRLGSTTRPVDSSMVDDVEEASDDVAPGANVAFAREMDLLQEAKLVIDWVCGKDGVEGKATDGLDVEMMREQEQEQEVRTPRTPVACSAPAEPPALCSRCACRRTSRERASERTNDTPVAGQGAPVIFRWVGRGGAFARFCDWRLTKYSELRNCRAPPPRDAQVEREVAIKAEETKCEFMHAMPPRPFTVGELIDGDVLRDGNRIFPLSEFQYGDDSLPLPFSSKLRISVNHAARRNVGSKPRRLKNVHVLLHYAGMTEEEVEEAYVATRDSERDRMTPSAGTTPPRCGDKAASKRSATGGLVGCGPRESFVAIICLLEAEQVRRTLMLDFDKTRILRSKIDGNSGAGWQLQPSLRSDDGSGAVDHEYDAQPRAFRKNVATGQPVNIVPYVALPRYDLFMGAQGAKFFNGQSYFRHDELPALLGCFEVDAAVSRDAFAARQKHAEDGQPQAGHAMASARFYAICKQVDDSANLKSITFPKADVRKQLRRWFFEEAMFARRRENREIGFAPVRKALENGDANRLQEAHRLMQLVRNAIEVQFREVVTRGTIAEAHTPLEAAFLSYDKDMNGKLTTDEIVTMLDQLHVEGVSIEQLASLLLLGGGTEMELSYSEFEQLFGADNAVDLLHLDNAIAAAIIAAPSSAAADTRHKAGAATSAAALLAARASKAAKASVDAGAGDGVAAATSGELIKYYAQLSLELTDFGGLPKHLIVGKTDDIGKWCIVGSLHGASDLGKRRGASTYAGTISGDTRISSGGGVRAAVVPLGIMISQVGRSRRWPARADCTARKDESPTDRPQMLLVCH